MVYSFNQYTLDPEKLELKKGSHLIAVEPQVFELLRFLIENRAKVVSKDALIEAVWGGRLVSDASVSSRIKSARHAVGDDGTSQNTIRTIYAKGFRFIAEVSRSGESEQSSRIKTSTLPHSANTLAKDPPLDTKPSIAILPFHFLGTPDSENILADALPHDLIQALSRLGWIFVIARGSSFRFRSNVTDVREIGKALGVRYVLSGSIENLNNTLTITTELSDTHTGGVVWSDRIVSQKDGVHQIRAEIVAKVISSLEVYIPLNEARNARLSVSEDLDSWSNYHLGLHHMYRFTLADNAKASTLFKTAAEQDQGFSRAWAGLSFTSFQSAFLKYNDGQTGAALDARRYAERSVELDPVDPFANFTLGRAFVLDGDLDSSIGWLDQAIALNPNYSQGYYSHAFTNMLSGNSSASINHFDKALILSPLDPLVYAMLAGRALSFVAEGDYESAAEAGEKAARAPGAHFIIDMIAVIAHALNHDQNRAQIRSDRVRMRRPDASEKLFFDSFPYSNSQIKHRISQALTHYGF
jgi:TolB-like protein